MPYQQVAKVSAVREGRPLKVVAEGQRFALFNVGGTIHAISDTCPHKGGSLSEGRVDGDVVSCPLHQWKFSVVDGGYPGIPSVKVRTYAVKIEGEDVWLDVPDPYGQLMAGLAEAADP